MGEKDLDGQVEAGLDVLQLRSATGELLLAETPTTTPDFAAAVGQDDPAAAIREDAAVEKDKEGNFASPVGPAGPASSTTSTPSGLKSGFLATGPFSSNLPERSHSTPESLPPSEPAVNGVETRLYSSDTEKDSKVGPQGLQLYERDRSPPVGEVGSPAVESGAESDPDLDPKLKAAMERELAWREVLHAAAQAVKKAPSSSKEAFEKAKKKEAEAKELGSKRRWGWFGWRSKDQKDQEASPKDKFLNTVVAATETADGKEEVSRGGQEPPDGKGRMKQEDSRNAREEKSPLKENRKPGVKVTKKGDGVHLSAERAQILVEMLEEQWSSGTRSGSKGSPRLDDASGVKAVEKLLAIQLQEAQSSEGKDEVRGQDPDDGSTQEQMDGQQRPEAASSTEERQSGASTSSAETSNRGGEAEGSSDVKPVEAEKPEVDILRPDTEEVIMDVKATGEEGGSDGSAPANEGAELDFDVIGDKGLAVENSDSCIGGLEGVEVGPVDTGLNNKQEGGAEEETEREVRVDAESKAGTYVAAGSELENDARASENPGNVGPRQPTGLGHKEEEQDVGGGEQGAVAIEAFDVGAEEQLGSASSGEISGVGKLKDMYDGEDQRRVERAGAPTDFAGPETLSDNHELQSEPPTGDEREAGSNGLNDRKVSDTTSDAGSPETAPAAAEINNDSPVGQENEGGEVHKAGAGTGGGGSPTPLLQNEVRDRHGNEVDAEPVGGDVRLAGAEVGDGPDAALTSVRGGKEVQAGAGESHGDEAPTGLVETASHGGVYQGSPMDASSHGVDYEAWLDAQDGHAGGAAGSGGSPGTKLKGKVALASHDTGAPHYPLHEEIILMSCDGHVILATVADEDLPGGGAVVTVAEEVSPEPTTAALALAAQDVVEGEGEVPSTVAAAGREVASVEGFIEPEQVGEDGDAAIKRASLEPGSGEMAQGNTAGPDPGEIATKDGPEDAVEAWASRSAALLATEDAARVTHGKSCSDSTAGDDNGASPSDPSPTSDGQDESPEAGQAHSMVSSDELEGQNGFTFDTSSEGGSATERPETSQLPSELESPETALPGSEPLTSTGDFAQARLDQGALDSDRLDTLGQKDTESGWERVPGPDCKTSEAVGLLSPEHLELKASPQGRHSAQLAIDLVTSPGKLSSGKPSPEGRLERFHSMNSIPDLDLDDSMEASRKMSTEFPKNEEDYQSCNASMVGLSDLNVEVDALSMIAEASEVSHGASPEASLDAATAAMIRSFAEEAVQDKKSWEAGHSDPDCEADAQRPQGVGAEVPRAGAGDSTVDSLPQASGNEAQVSSGGEAREGDVEGSQGRDGERRPEAGAESSPESPGNSAASTGLELALCKHLLHDRMGVEAAATAFDAHRVSMEQFMRSANNILHNDRLVARVAGRYYPWSAAAPRLIGMLAFGKVVPPISADLDGAIAVEKAEPKPSPGAIRENGKTRAGGNQDLALVPGGKQGGWKLWPFGGGRRPSSNGGTGDGGKANNIPIIPPEMMLAAAGAALENPLTKEILYGVNGFYARPRKHRTRALLPTKEQLATLPLQLGKNLIRFSFTTRMLGKQQVECSLYVWKHNSRVVISDVDGTITKSDVLGQVMPLVGRDWSQVGVARLFSAIRANGYELMFLSARAITQAYLTRTFLFNLKQDGSSLPEGPVVISPDGLFPSLYREVIRRAPQEFKIACLSDIKALFPADRSPFYAGFGNRPTDEISYEAVGISKGKIFIINPKGEVAVSAMVDSKSYHSLHELVHDIFPAMNAHEDEHPQREDFNDFNFWKMPLQDIDDDLDFPDPKNKKALALSPQPKLRRKDSYMAAGSTS